MRVASISDSSWVRRDRARHTARAAEPSGCRHLYKSGILSWPPRSDPQVDRLQIEVDDVSLIRGRQRSLKAIAMSKKRMERELERESRRQVTALRRMPSSGNGPPSSSW